MEPDQNKIKVAQTYDELTFKAKAVVVKMASSRKQQTSHSSGGEKFS